MTTTTNDLKIESFIGAITQFEFLITVESMKSIFELINVTTIDLQKLTKVINSIQVLKSTIIIECLSEKYFINSSNL